MDQNPAIESLESKAFNEIGGEKQRVVIKCEGKRKREKKRKHTIQEESHSILMWPLTAYLKATQKVLTRLSSIKKFGKALHTPTKEGNCYSSIVWDNGLANILNRPFFSYLLVLKTHCWKCSPFDYIHFLIQWLLKCTIKWDTPGTRYTPPYTTHTLCKQCDKALH